ncbi:MAG TPA: hypothetical protein VER17_19220 [Tepidisphaeraceae bacterium]|nr:hypothetical protein [Tepidisphaeraceae bacterium]
MSGTIGAAGDGAAGEFALLRRITSEAAGADAGPEVESGAGIGAAAAAGIRLISMPSTGVVCAREAVPLSSASASIAAKMDRRPATVTAPARREGWR